jgi:hypothetical protein
MRLKLARWSCVGVVSLQTSANSYISFFINGLIEAPVA